MLQEEVPEENQLEEILTEKEMDGFECDVGCQGTNMKTINDTRGKKK